MKHFTAHRLVFECKVVTPLRLNPHTGSAIRGAFYHALWNQFCMNHAAPACAACPLVATCPVAFLVSTLDPKSDRGANVPRPYTIQPPLGPPLQGEESSPLLPELALASASATPASNLQGEESSPLLPELALASASATPASNLQGEESSPLLPEGEGPGMRAKTDYAPGETLTFGLTMYARALNLFPYVVLAMQRLENGGLGKRIADNGGRRGTFRVRQVWAENPLTGERRQVLRQGETIVQVPDIPITNEQIINFQFPIANSQLTIDLLTPMRLIDDKQLVKRIAFRPFIQRLHGRLKQLSANFSDTPLDHDFRQVLAQAEAVRVARDETHWVELESYSTRLNRATPLGGLMGRVTFEGDLAPFWPELLWGQFTHVGKDAVKGNGMYQLSMTNLKIDN